MAIYIKVFMLRCEGELKVLNVAMIDVKQMGYMWNLTKLYDNEI